MTINPSASPSKNVKLIIGLGNPGPQYKNTYHNAGFIAVDYLAQRLEAKAVPSSSNRHFVALKANSFYLAKPTSFMNQSGNAVSEIIKFFKIPPSQTLIIHDDSDIELGLYKLSFGRGGAGHNGVLSIINRLKTKDFWRLRLGIRPIHPPKFFFEKFLRAQKISNRLVRLKAGDFVLSKIKPRHLKIFYSILGDVMVKLTENEKP